MAASLQTDVLIVGGGLVGGTLACALAEGGLLSIVIDRTKDSNLATHIHLSRGERSALATYASKVL